MPEKRKRQTAADRRRKMREYMRQRRDTPEKRLEIRIKDARRLLEKHGFDVIRKDGGENGENE